MTQATIDAVLSRMPAAISDRREFKSVFLDLSRLLGATEFLVCKRDGSSLPILPFNSASEIGSCPLLSDFGGSGHIDDYLNRVCKFDYWGSREHALPCHQAVYMSEFTIESIGENAVFDTWLEYISISETIFVKVFEFDDSTRGCIGINFYFPAGVPKNHNTLKLVNKVSVDLESFLEPYFKGFVPCSIQNVKQQLNATGTPMLVVSKESKVLASNSPARALLETAQDGEGKQIQFENQELQLVFKRLIEQVEATSRPVKYTVRDTNNNTVAFVHICPDTRLGETAFLVSYEPPNKPRVAASDLVDDYLMDFARSIGLIVNESRPPKISIEVMKRIILRYSDEEICREMNLKFTTLRHHIENVIFDRVRNNGPNRSTNSLRLDISKMFYEYVASLENDT